MTISITLTTRERNLLKRLLTECRDFAEDDMRESGGPTTDDGKTFAARIQLANDTFEAVSVVEGAAPAAALTADMADLLMELLDMDADDPLHPKAPLRLRERLVDALNWETAAKK